MSARLSNLLLAGLIALVGCSRGDEPPPPAPPPGPTGTIEWTCSLEAPTEADCALAGDLVLIGDREGTLYGVDRDSGTIRWRYRAEGAIVAAAIPAGHFAIATDLAGFVHAVALDTGRRLWRVDTGSPIHGPASLVDDSAAVTNEDGRLLRLALADGVELLRAELPVQTFGAPGVGEGLLIVAGCNAGQMFAIDIDSGRQRNGIETLGPVRPAPLVIDGSAIVADTTGRVQRYDLTRGEPLWPAPAEAGEGMLLSVPVLAGGRVVLGGADNAVYAFDPATGVRLWRAGGRDGFEATVAADDSAIYAACLDGTLHALDLATGEAIWTLRFASALRSAPAARDGRVYLAESDGRLHAVSTPR